MLHPVSDPLEARNDAIHRRVAALIRRDPSVIARVRSTLEGWIAEEPLPAWLEWRGALSMLDAEELASFLESPTPRARRMRSSSPFFFLGRELEEASAS